MGSNQSYNKYLNKKSQNRSKRGQIGENRSLDVIDELTWICEEVKPFSDKHCLRVLFKLSTTMISSRNPHILLKIAKWHKARTNFVGFEFDALKSSNNTSANEYVFKMTLTNSMNDNWMLHFIQYIDETTSYNLNASIPIHSGGHDSHFMSWSFIKKE